MTARAGGFSAEDDDEQARTNDWGKNRTTHPCARAQLFYREVDGGLVYARAAKRLDDLSLPKKGRRDTKIGLFCGKAFEGIMNDGGSTERREGRGLTGS